MINHLHTYLTYYPLRTNPANDYLLYVGETGNGKRLAEVYIRFKKQYVNNIHNDLLLLVNNEGTPRIFHGNAPKLLCIDEVPIHDFIELSKLFSYYNNDIVKLTERLHPYHSVTVQHLSDLKQRYTYAKSTHVCMARVLRNKITIYNK